MYNARGCRDIFKKFRPRRISLEIWLEIGRRNHPIETRLGIWRDTPIAGKREREGERYWSRTVSWFPWTRHLAVINDKGW